MISAARRARLGCGPGGYLGEQLLSPADAAGKIYGVRHADACPAADEPHDASQVALSPAGLLPCEESLDAPALQRKVTNIYHSS